MKTMLIIRVEDTAQQSRNSCKEGVTSQRLTTEVAQWARSEKTRERSQLAKGCVLARKWVWVKDGRCLKQVLSNGSLLSVNASTRRRTHPVFTSVWMEWIFILHPDMLKQLEGKKIQKVFQDTGMRKKTFWITSRAQEIASRFNGATWMESFCIG